MTEEQEAAPEATAETAPAPTAAEVRKQKYPELHAAAEKLEAEKAKLVAASAPLRTERDALVQEIQPTENKIRELNEKIEAIERPRMGELDNQLGGLARAMGGKSLANPEA
jgi:peptidoglycan hydrolase CwlO-like protein